MSHIHKLIILSDFFQGNEDSSQYGHTNDRSMLKEEDLEGGFTHQEITTDAYDSEDNGKHFTQLRKRI